MATYKINRSVIVTASRTGRLDLHDLHLEDVPADIFTQPMLLDNLTSIDLSQNKLRSLPAGLARFPKLRELLVDDNLLTTLPMTLCECPALRSVCLDGNPLPRELLNIYSKARGVAGTSGRGRDAAPVLQWILAHEEQALAKEEQLVDEEEAAMPPSISAAPTPPESATVSPVVSRPSSADSASSEASRTKQRSLQSDIFSSHAAPAFNHHHAASNNKRHNVASHQTSNVFSCASQPMTGRTGRRQMTPVEGGSAMTAPFGTDAQPVAAKKERRVAREDTEKENEASPTVKSSPYAYLQPNPLEDAKKANKQQHVAQSPFATVAHSHDLVKSSNSSDYTAPSSSERPALTPVAVEQKKPHVGQSSDMSQALSSMSLIGHGGAEPVKRTGGRARVNHGQVDTKLW